MLNFIMSGNEAMWEKSPVFFEKGRCLTEYILPELKEQYGSLSAAAIQQLKQFPCIFAYEKALKRDAKIGYFEKIELWQNNVRMDYRLTGEKISFDKLLKLSDLLDVAAWEWNRTHWTLKKTLLEDIRPYITSVSKRPTVFVSYCWSPTSNQQNVIKLINRLERDGIDVIYDKKDLHPGQDMNYFMENTLVSQDIDGVIIVCNADYAQKADERSGGVGYESGLILTEIRNNPMQTKFIPVVIERDAEGRMTLPAFLKSRLCIDLTQDSGYEELLQAIQYSQNEEAMG